MLYDDKRIMGVQLLQLSGEIMARKKVGEGNSQVVEVRYGDNIQGKTYSYVGGGNLRTGQVINNAPVTHPGSGKNYTTKAVVVATHNVAGAQVGDTVGVENGRVRSIPKPLKYLAGDKELLQDREIEGMEGTTTSQYIGQFSGTTATDRLGRYISTPNTAEASSRLARY